MRLAPLQGQPGKSPGSKSYGYNTVAWLMEGMSEGLRRVQDHVPSYERRFREVERDDIADNLETCTNC